MKASRTSTPWSLLLIAVAGLTTAPSSEAAVSVQETPLRAKPAVALVSAEKFSPPLLRDPSGQPLPDSGRDLALSIDGHLS